MERRDNPPSRFPNNGCRFFTSRSGACLTTPYVWATHSVVFLRNTVYGKAEKEGNCIVEKLDKQCLRQVIKRNSNRDKSCY